MRLAKWQGAGNDYLIVEESALPAELSPTAIGLLCDRHLGLGADGILLNCRPTGAVEGAVSCMRIFNPDGSEPEMCGNGIRMFARYLQGQGFVREREFVIETLAGPIRPFLQEDGGVRVDMGVARFRSANMVAPLALDAEKAGSASAGEDVVNASLEVAGRRYQFTFVDVGNPHCVIQVENPDTFDVVGVGPLIERHAMFPNRVNVEFIAIELDGSVRMRVWERGVGETQACGTGATAVGAACVRLGLASSPVVVHLRGGDLIIEAEGDAEPEADGGRLRVHMTGPAEEVFLGEISKDLRARLGWSQGLQRDM
jgi:diaminopimelate epimerase